VPDAPHILVVDDDRRLRQLLTTYLADNGFRVTAAASAAEARGQMDGLVFDLIVLDIMMPGETGLSLTGALREANNKVPILMLSALADTDDRINGLTAGSDDYLPKPFEPRELLLRIQNLLRRVAPVSTTAQDVRFGTFTFNRERGELRRDGELVRITTREREFLRLLSQHAGQPVPRTDLAQPGSEDSARSVDVQINRLRQKIEDDPSNPIYLQTVRGAGYVLHLN
jgi:two-component system, OmpR family, phosphate regulon response regulator OmpR